MEPGSDVGGHEGLLPRELLSEEGESGRPLAGCPSSEGSENQDICLHYQLLSKVGNRGLSSKLEQTEPDKEKPEWKSKPVNDIGRTDEGTKGLHEDSQNA